MTPPRILLAVALVAAGLLTPAVTASLGTVPPGVVGMGHDTFIVNGVDPDQTGDGAVPTITLHVGERLAFQNNSRWIHILGPGAEGKLAAEGTGSMQPLQMVEENGSYITAPWTVPGSYLITCTVHPDMNAKVVVLP